jgi:hypothetical protein
MFSHRWGGLSHLYVGLLEMNEWTKNGFKAHIGHCRMGTAVFATISDAACCKCDGSYNIETPLLVNMTAAVIKARCTL